MIKLKPRDINLGLNTSGLNLDILAPNLIIEDETKQQKPIIIIYKGPQKTNKGLF